MDLYNAVDLVGVGVGPLPGRVLVGVVARAAGGRRGETARLPGTPTGWKKLLFDATVTK